MTTSLHVINILSTFGYSGPAKSTALFRHQKKWKAEKQVLLDMDGDGWERGRQKARFNICTWAEAQRRHADRTELNKHTP